MTWSTAKELFKTFAVLAIDVVAFFCVMALLVSVSAATVVGVFAILWFWLGLLF